jgi:hypothetical protein
VTVGASEWATAQFGVDAQSTAGAIVAGLLAAHTRAVHAHIGGGLATADAYGGVMWLAAADEILNRIADIEGAGRIKPDRARYCLGVVNNSVIFPQRIGTDLRTPPTEAKLTMSRVRADIFSLGPASGPAIEHPTLFDDMTVDTAQETTLEDVADLNDARLVVVAYVSSPDGGLLRVWWGHAALLDDGRLDWHHLEQLDLNQPETVARRADLRLVNTGPHDEPTSRRFNDVPLEETPLGVRNPLIAPMEGRQEPELPTGGTDDS